MFLYKCKNCGIYMKLSDCSVLNRTKVHHCVNCLTLLPTDLIYFAYSIANYKNTESSEVWEVFSIPDDLKDSEIAYELPE